MKLPPETKINENVDCFCKIEVGTKTHDSQKKHFKEGNVAFNESINVIIEKEQEVKVSFWYTENDNSFVLIGRGQVDLSTQKKMLSSNIKIMKDGVESGSISFKIQADTKE